MSYQRDQTLRYLSKKYPLPWAWNWCTGELGNGTGTTYPEPAWQKAQIQAGKKIIPTCELNSSFVQATWASKGAYAQPAFEAARDYGLPVVFVANNIFHEFKNYPEFINNADPAAPDDHAWMIKAGSPDTTSDDVLSLYSDLTGVWSERMGYLHATCEIVQNAISIYSTPPLVILFDNNESGFDWDVAEAAGNYDIREPSDIAALRNWYTANIGSYSGPAADAITSRYNSLMNTRRSDMERYMKYRFQVGWYKGLREYSKHWEAVAYYIPYGQSSVEFLQGDSYKVMNGADPVLAATVGIRSYVQPGGSGGKSSESYFNNTYGAYSGRTRIWKVSATQAWARRFHRYVHGVNLPDNICLTWQGNNYPPLDGDNTTPPDAETIWKNYCTMTAWLNRSRMVGNFQGSSTQIAWASIMRYYEVCMEICEDAHKPTLMDFWQYGQIAESLETNPDTVYDGTHFDWHTAEQWPFQHANASSFNRYTSAARSDPLYSTATASSALRRYLSQLGRNVDRLRTTTDDNTIWRYACFAIELDGDYAIYSWSTVEATDFGNINIWLPVGETIHTVSVPFNSTGAWTIYESGTTTTTSYDPSTETASAWRPWKDTSTALSTQRKAELDARKQHIADVIAYTQSTAAATPAPLSAPEQAAADTAKQTATDYVNYISQGS